ncbi:Protein FLOWERING LOCUS D [Lachnellula suecica]|uniref:Protein FLOWERING LOCUS D n=1 Tax=Lachnellula suecica TaxID=602035 RepID=A0A8T9CH28_9HELO|nr:Protein FLOWERING LOCUS D [Lachnellula suecica]
MAAPEKKSQPHVCVVGAGISGLRCADVLLQHGFQVTIFEARERIGGRILTQPEGLTPMKHATGGKHPIRDLAIATSTPLHTWNSHQNIYTSSGTLLPKAKAASLSTLLWDIIEEAFEYSEAHGASIPETASLYDFIAEKVIEKIPGDDETAREDRKLVSEMSEMWGAYVGHPVSRQSLKFAWLEECCGGEEMFIETTYESIFEAISKPALDGAVIQLKKRVTKITTPEARNSSKISVTTEEGQKFEFDEVVLTTPLGWLKRNKAAFQPALPERILQGMENISVGILEKVYITFPTAFWTEGLEDNFAGYTNWLSPAYASDTNPHQWPQEIWNLAAFSPENRRPTILFYIYGDCSTYITTLVRGKADAEHYTLLDAFFKPYYSLLPNFEEGKAECKPKAILSTEWQKDELNGNGSYCNFQVGIKDAAGDVKAIREGCPERRLWFAGEHTAPFEELGTAAGAYMSGEAVGTRIAEKYKAI